MMKRIAAVMGLSLALMATGTFPATGFQGGQAVADDDTDDDGNGADDEQTGVTVGALPALAAHWR